jgi:hypothetical protein
MNNAQKYVSKQMENEEFRQAYFEEKMKLDLEFLIDELVESIKLNKPKHDLLKGARRIKRMLINS